MAYLNRLRDLEIGRVYTPHKDVKRKSPGHWHNNYYIPLERVSAKDIKAITVNPSKPADVSVSDTWSDFVRRSMFKDITDDAIALKGFFNAIF